MAEKAPAEEFVPDDIPALEDAIKVFASQREQVMQQIRDLRAAESRDSGAQSAQEIFMLQQEKLRLDAEIDFREKKIRRIRYTEEMNHC